MQEFSSISVSSFEAGTLADQLTQKSSEGWEVAAIIPTGTTVTAYLSRQVDVAAVAADPVADEIEQEPVAEAEFEAQLADEIVAEAELEAALEEVAAEDAYDEAVADVAAAEGISEAEAEDAVDEAIVEEAIVEAAIAEELDGASADDEIAALAAAVVAEAGEPTLPDTPEDEPGGWALSDDSSAAAEVTADEPDTEEPTSEEPDAEPATEPDEEPDAAATTSAAPAGWYADPSGRFELRYWDGSQWTEHVSRAGQQFTDPPVA